MAKGKHAGNPEARRAAVVSQEAQKFLAQINRGAFLAEIGETLRTVNDTLSKIASQRSSATGEITLKFKVRHDSHGRVEVTPDMSKKLPKESRGTQIFWSLDDGELASKDPHQLELGPIREVESDADVREVDDDERPPVREVQS